MEKNQKAVKIQCKSQNNSKSKSRKYTTQKADDNINF